MVMRLIAFFLAISVRGFAEPSMKDLLKEGKTLAREENKKAFELGKSISSDDLLPSNQKGKSFDADEAKDKLKKGTYHDSEAYEFVTSDRVLKNVKDNQGFHKDEFFLKHSENISKNAEKEDEIIEEETIEHESHRCKESGDPFVISLIRELNIVVDSHPSKCLGHELVIKHSTGGQAALTIKQYKGKLSADPTVEWYDVSMMGGGMKDSYNVLVKWRHKSGTATCENCQREASIIKEEWIYDDPSLLSLIQTPDCTLVQQTCLDTNSSKSINGHSISRKCWKEQLSFVYQFPLIRECLFLKTHNCELLEQHCIQQTPFGCALWEKSFRCFSKIIKTRTSAKSVFGLGEEWKTEYQPNHSFADVAIKLSVFEEAEKDLKKAQDFDATKLTVFKGEKLQCSKNVAGDLMYDCCFKYSGLAKQVGLSKCSSDELSLAERRENGLCYYVGSYEEKMLDLWKSRDEHVFCCFSTKLARVVHEEGRRQLKKGWGEPKHPDCGGFSMEELSKLNFSKMDLTEVFDQLPKKMPDGFEQKMEAFQDRIRLQVENDEVHNERL